MASLSDFTNKDKFTDLIIKIDRDITSDSVSNLQVNNHLVQIGGSTIAPKVATSTTGLAPLDAIANTIGSSVNSFKTSITGGIAGAASSFGLSTDGSKPTVMNLSSAGLDTSAVTNGITKLTSYLPPSNLALSAFDKLGKSIDDMIKDSLIVQMFHIKGTDILCTSLCLLMSLIPCQITNKIVDAIQSIKDLQSEIQSGLAAAASAERFAASELNTGFSGGATGLANIADVKKSLTTAFTPVKGGTTKDQIVQQIKSYTAGLATIVNVLNMLISVARLGWADPNAILGFLVNGMFDLLENVLLALQTMAVQMADKVINKVIAPIEKYFNTNTFPALCGIGAQLLFKKILAVIYNFKKKLLAFIADLFSFQKSARKKFELFNKNMLWSLELSALLKVFSLLLGNFVDIAIACGVGRRPCPGPVSDAVNLSENFNGGFTEDSVAYNNPIYKQPAVVSSTPPDGTLNQIAVKLQPLIDSIFPGSSNQVEQGAVRTQLTDLPPMIANLLGTIDLGNNTTLYQNNNSATIIYNNIALCGAH